MPSSFSPQIPSTSPLHQKIEELFGEVPPPDPTGQNIWIPFTLFRPLSNRIGSEAAAALALFLGNWLLGETVHEALGGPRHDSSNKRGIKRLQKEGLITYDKSLDLATLNEKAVVSLLDQVKGDSRE